MPENKTTSLQCSKKSSIKKAVVELALARGASPSKKVIDLYIERLEKESAADVIAALEMISDLPRKEGELAFPEIGTILAAVSMTTVSRANRERAEDEYFQQQMCPKCAGLVGMMRKRGDQFRTWCLACQAYRKIVPEDLELTALEWELLCLELDRIYNAWIGRGSIPSECVDTQLDRAQFRGYAA